MIGNSADGLRRLLADLSVDGIEALFCDPWDPAILPAACLHGVHLNFWPTWLDFWRGDQQALKRQFGSNENVLACFGGLSPDHLLASFRRDVAQAKAAAAKYLVFHVSHNEPDEIYTWNFRVDDKTVIDATAEVVNCITDEISDDMMILFENLWWPGMTLLNPSLVDRLLSRVRHPRVGIMLDTGHLMNTNPDLVDERQGVDYCLNVLGKLGSLSQSIRGIHLHQSLSGEYVKASRRAAAPEPDLVASMAHIMRIDRHQPFSDPRVREILEFVEPDYLVHEFIVSSYDELKRYTTQQRHALK